MLLNQLGHARQWDMSPARPRRLARRHARWRGTRDVRPMKAPVT